MTHNPSNVIPPSETSVSRRRVLGGLAAGAALAAARTARAEPGLVLNDASGLNPTRVARHFVIRSGSDQAILAQFRAELKDAAAADRPVALGVARHSMGGQSLARQGSALTLRAAGVAADRAAGLFRAQCGARWRDVIATLDPLGLSPAVMQSNNDFGVASTFAVNAHGWPVPHGPFGTTVRSLRLMLADGSVVTCSPSENAGLFGMAMGGYGLVGIVIDIDAATAPNQLLTPSFQRMPGAEFAPRFVALCTDPAVTIAYGRLDVSAHNFFNEALMIGYRPTPLQPASLPRAGTGGAFSALSRQVYRAQTGSDTAKRARWFIEAEVGPHAFAGAATRNALLNEPVANLASADTSRTDILHEYFVPPARFAEFLAACRAIIPASRQDLLNVTLRYVQADGLSLLTYAPGPRIAAVMSFTQRMTSEAEADMRLMTQALIDAVTGLGGSFYLPYRLHARPDQVRRAYPGLDAFIAEKRRLDPGLLFRNAMWDSWCAGGQG